MYAEHGLLRNLFWSYVAVNTSNGEELLAVCTYQMDILTSIHEHFNVLGGPYWNWMYYPIDLFHFLCFYYLSAFGRNKVGLLIV